MYVGLDVPKQACYETMMDEKGRGIVLIEDEEHVLEPGDIVHIPAGEVHWHGAAEDSDFEHLYVVPRESKTTY